MNKKMKKSAWLDTNIILRFLLKDDPQLFQAVEPLFLQVEQGDLEIYIHPIIIAELIWTLESYYEYSKKDCRSNVATRWSEGCGSPR